MAPVSIADSFWLRVHKTTTCWIWTGAKTVAGYGVLQINRKRIYAHRFAWMLTHADLLTSGQQVCHHCDNPPCVRPAHLFRGTATDNLRDAASKGRLPGPGFVGADHPRARLTTRQVLTIRARYKAGGILQRELAAKYHVSQLHISRIVRGVGWKHL